MTTQEERIRSKAAQLMGRRGAQVVKERYGDDYWTKIQPKKPIVQMDLEGNEIKTHPSATDASRETGVNLSNIRRVLYGYRNRATAGGYKWKYAEPKV